MKIGVAGLSYKNAPVEIRGKFVLQDEQKCQLTKKLLDSYNALECVVVSTCNRTEIYFVFEDDEFNSETVELLLCSVANIEIYCVKKLFYNYVGEKAVEHLFKVASGLDSMILGEDQILGQIRESYELSCEAGGTDVILNTLFRQAITAAKKVKTNTEISKTPVSVASIAVRLVNQKIEGGVYGKTALVIGTGKIGRIAMKYLLAQGASKIYVTMRTHKPKDSLRVEFEKDWPKIQCVEYAMRYKWIKEAEIIISSTSSPHYTITKDCLDEHEIAGKKMFVDLAVPRDIDVETKENPDFEYIHLDMLADISTVGMDKKESEKLRALGILQEYLEEFRRWYDFRNHLPVVKTFQKFAQEIVDKKSEKVLSKLKDISPQEREWVRANFAGAVNGMMDKFVYSVRECATKDDMDVYFECLRSIIETEDTE